MDATSLATAALAVAIEDSRTAAVRELMLDRERVAMANEDAHSYIAQRHFVRPVQAPPRDNDQTWTWREAFQHQGAELHRVRTAMRSTAGILRHVLTVLDREMDDPAPPEARGANAVA